MKKIFLAFISVFPITVLACSGPNVLEDTINIFLAWLANIFGFISFIFIVISSILFLSNKYKNNKKLKYYQKLFLIVFFVSLLVYVYLYVNASLLCVHSQF